MSRRPILSVLGLALVALLALVVPAGAAAAPWKCEASVVRGAVGTSPPVEPITANKGAAECVTQSAGGAPPPGLPGEASGSQLLARTSAAGDASNPAGQRVSAEASLDELHIPLLPGLPAFPAPPQVAPVSVPGFGTIDLNPAIQALAAPSGDLVGIRGLDARVTGQCSGGSPALAGTSAIGALTVLGIPIGTDKAGSRTLDIDSRSIDPSNLDPTLIAPQGVNLTAFKAALQPVLDSLPNIAIPAAVAHLQVTPGQKIRRGDTLTQRALTIALSIGGQSVVDLVAGEATVGANGVPCGAATAGAALRCTTRRLVLIDVVRHKARVRLLGAADPRLAGRRVTIVYADTGKRVARPTVGSDRLFRATAPLPPRSVRGTNRARYQARIGKERSLRLKLARRLHVTEITPKGRQVVISGRISKPLGKPLQTVTVTRRLSCGRVEVVKRFKPRKDGRFRVTLSGAGTRQVATFRFRTLVRFRAGNPRLFRTFTLPQYVDIG
jgi:hypothetical protein